MFKKNYSGFVFHHVPKCAGTSFVSELYKIFCVISDYDKDYTDFNHYLNSKFPEKYLNMRSILVGHWNQEGNYFFQRYPRLFNNPRVFSICFLRDPFEVSCSLFKYQKKHKLSDQYTFSTLEDHFRFNKNLLSSWIGYSGDSPQSFLHKYQFVGVVENFNKNLLSLKKSMLKFCAEFNNVEMSFQVSHQIQQNFPVELPRLNDSSSPPNEFNFKDYHDLFIDNNQLDYKLYNAALNLS
jgi:hypothetical protein